MKLPIRRDSQEYFKINFLVSCYGIRNYICLAKFRRATEVTHNAGGQNNQNGARLKSSDDQILKNKIHL